jgi:hypothetical protein
MPTKRRPTKPGPVPVSPSKDDRRRVEIGIGGGFSAAALARLFDMPRTSFNRVFAVEVETGRARIIVEMGLVLYKQAQAGSAAAAKGLLGFVERSAPAGTQAESRWAGFADRVHERDTRNLADREISKLDS